MDSILPSVVVPDGMGGTAGVTTKPDPARINLRTRLAVAVIVLIGVSLTHGRLDISSAQGVGSRFTMVLPRSRNGKDVAGRAAHGGRRVGRPVGAQFALAGTFMRNPGRVLSREQLLSSVCG